MTNIIKELHGFPQVSIIVMALVVMAVAESLFNSRVEKDIPSRPLVDFPLVLGDWVGNQQPMIASIVDFLKVSDYAMVDYKSDGHLVNLYIAYYQSLDEEAFPHTPRKCIPAGGWEIETLSEIELGQREARRVKIVKGGNTQIVYYWYQQGDDSVAGEYQLKWNTMLRSLWEGRTDTSLVRLTTPVANDESDNEGDARLMAFARDLEFELIRRLN